MKAPQKSNKPTGKHHKKLSFQYLYELNNSLTLAKEELSKCRNTRGIYIHIYTYIYQRARKGGRHRKNKKFVQLPEKLATLVAGFAGHFTRI